MANAIGAGWDARQLVNQITEQTPYLDTFGPVKPEVLGLIDAYYKKYPDADKALSVGAGTAIDINGFQSFVPGLSAADAGWRSFVWNKAHDYYKNRDIPLDELNKRAGVAAAIDASTNLIPALKGSKYFWKIIPEIFMNPVRQGLINSSKNIAKLGATTLVGQPTMNVLTDNLADNINGEYIPKTRQIVPEQGLIQLPQDRILGW